jgi:hypothetical protein
MASQLAGRGQLAFFEQQFESVTYAVVVDGQYIRPAELEHQHHLHGPSTDATHGNETFDDRFVIELKQCACIGHDAIDRLARKILQSDHFGCRKTGCSQNRGIE